MRGGEEECGEIGVEVSGVNSECHPVFFSFDLFKYC